MYQSWMMREVAWQRPLKVEVMSVSQSQLMQVLPMFKYQLMQVEVLAKSRLERELQWPQVMRSKSQLIR